MLIELQNFGPIKSFQFDTSKDIHAIFGKNNIGKSYAISAVYLILKNLCAYSNYDLTLNKQPFDFQDTAIASELTESAVKNIILQHFQDSLHSSLIADLTNSFQNSFEFKTIQNANAQNPLQIIITFQLGILSIGLDEDRQKFKIIELELFPEFKIYDSDTYKFPPENIIERHSIVTGKQIGRAHV